MQLNFRVTVGILFLYLNQSVLATEYWIESVYTDGSGTVSMVVQIPRRATLEASNIKLLENDTPTVGANKVQSFEDTAWKLALAIYVDTSGTMVPRKGHSADNPLGETKSALHELLTKNPFRAQDKVAITAFEDEPRPLQYFSGREHELKTAVDALTQLKMKTLIYDALYDALVRLEHLPEAPPVRKRILVISDGLDEDPSRKTKIEKVINKARSLKIPIDVVVRVRADLVDKARSGGLLGGMEQLAAETHGQSIYAQAGEVYAALKHLLQVTMENPVVDFNRQVDPTVPKTTNVGVYIENANASPYSINMPYTISRTKSQTNWFPWVLGGGLLIFAALAVLILRGRRSGDEPLETPDIAPVSSDEIEEPKQERGVTRIGGSAFPAPAPGHAAAVLKGINGPLHGLAFHVDKTKFLIGAYKENDLSISDKHVSGDHAFISYDKGNLYVSDCDSTNGTFVNGQKLGSSSVSIRRGDRIRFANTEFEVTDTPG